MRGLTSLFLGVLLGLVGIDSQTGASRFAFRVRSCSTVSMWSCSRWGCSPSAGLYVAAYQSRLNETMEKLRGSIWMSLEDWRRSWPAWLRATVIGFPFGTIPAGGTEIPTFLSYATEKKLSKHPEEFGKCDRGRGGT